MSYLNSIHYVGCKTCKKPCQTQHEIDNHTCNDCTRTINHCTIPNPSCCNEHSAIGSVDDTTCNPVECNEGCETTINASCVILETYCLINECNCTNEPISLELFLIQLCSEIQTIKNDIDCLKQQIPACSGEVVCTSGVFTNSIF